MQRTIIAVALLHFACATKQKIDEPAPIATPARRAPTSDDKPPANVQEAVAAMKRNFNRIFFAFDSANLTPDSRGALAENVEIMRAFPEVIVEVQGHCDDRGTTEYNLALGQRRADAILKYMTMAGVPGSRVSAVSYGEERPLHTGPGEIAWSRNRRAEFRITQQHAIAVDGTTPR
jgi:peptidoglycan-associated lipoprotein